MDVDDAISCRTRKKSNTDAADTTTITTETTTSLVHMGNASTMDIDDDASSDDDNLFITNAKRILLNEDHWRLHDSDDELADNSDDTDTDSIEFNLTPEMVDNIIIDIAEGRQPDDFKMPAIVEMMINSDPAIKKNDRRIRNRNTMDWNNYSLAHCTHKLDSYSKHIERTKNISFEITPRNHDYFQTIKFKLENEYLTQNLDSYKITTKDNESDYIKGMLLVDHNNEPDVFHCWLHAQVQRT